MDIQQLIIELEGSDLKYDIADLHTKAVMDGSFKLAEYLKPMISTSMLLSSIISTDNAVVLENTFENLEITSDNARLISNPNFLNKKGALTALSNFFPKMQGDIKADLTHRLLRDSHHKEAVLILSGVSIEDHKDIAKSVRLHIANFRKFKVQPYGADNEWDLDSIKLFQMLDLDVLSEIDSLSEWKKNKYEALINNVGRVSEIQGLKTPVVSSHCGSLAIESNQDVPVLAARRLLEIESTIPFLQTRFPTHFPALVRDQDLSEVINIGGILLGKPVADSVTGAPSRAFTAVEQGVVSEDDIFKSMTLLSVEEIDRLMRIDKGVNLTLIPLSSMCVIHTKKNKANPDIAYALRYHAPFDSLINRQNSSDRISGYVNPTLYFRGCPFSILSRSGDSNLLNALGRDSPQIKLTEHESAFIQQTLLGSPDLSKSIYFTQNLDNNIELEINTFVNLIDDLTDRLGFEPPIRLICEPEFIIKLSEVKVDIKSLYTTGMQNRPFSSIDRELATIGYCGVSKIGETPLELCDAQTILKKCVTNNDVILKNRMLGRLDHYSNTELISFASTKGQYHFIQENFKLSPDELRLIPSKMINHDVMVDQVIDSFNL